MSKKTAKLKMKYTKKFPDGTTYIDADGFQALKEEQTIFCYNKEEANSSLWEFFCSICNRSFKGLKTCENHWGNSKHKKQLHGHESKIKHSKGLRKLTDHEDSILTNVLIKGSEENLMSDDDVIERMNVCRDVEETIKASGVYDISCHLFGSSVTRIGFCDSNVNIDIQYDIEKISKVMPEITDIPLFLFHIHSTIKDSAKFCDVADLFHMSTPRFTFTHVESGLHCVICPYYKPGVRSSMMIKDYISMDERAKTLCIAFRKWAKICGVDDPAGGSLSPYCFTLLIIHYLQQVEPPVLPIINLQKQLYLPPGLRHKNEKNFINTDQIENWRSNNKSSIGTLWVGLFKFYLLDFFFKTHVVNITQHSLMTKQLRGLNSRRMSIEDPFFQKDNVANTLTASDVMDYFYSCLEKSYRYFSGCDAIERCDKKIEVSPESGKKSERKKRKDDKRRSAESTDSKKNDRTQKNDGCELPSHDSNKSKDKKLTEECDIEESLDQLAKSIVADVVGESDGNTDINKSNVILTDSEDEDSTSPSDEKNPVKNERQEDSDSEEESPDEDEDSDDEADAEDYVNGDNDLLNEHESSDVEIEEEYIEQNGKLVRVDAGDEENCVIPSGNEQSTDYHGTVSDAVNVANGETRTENEVNHSSNEDSDRHRHSSRDYDSQYDGDVDDSQTEDDSKLVYVEGRLMEGLTPDKPDENNDISKLSEGAAQLEKSQNGVIEHSALHNELFKIDEILPNINKLSIGDAGSVAIQDVERGEKISDPNSDGKGLSVMMANILQSQVAAEQDNSSPVINKVKSETQAVDHNDIQDVIVKQVVEEILKPSRSEKTDDSSHKKSKSPDFSFSRKSLAPLRSVPLFCKICNKDGHRKTDCDSMNIGKPVPLPPMTQAFFDMLDRLCEQIFKENELTSYEKEQRMKILNDMEKHLKKYFNTTCRLALFGSSVNNFGFRGSDLDICLRFGSADPPPGLDHAQMVVKVAKALDKHEDFHKVMYIKSAKVPIVKFVIKSIDLEGDISLYNCLALNNSRMLKAYSLIDKRVRILGYCAKVFAKVCEMGDASRGSLSSYAYTLLTLFYLQRCEPPVIPVLQDLYDHSSEKPTSMVEGWNTWYFSDIDNLGKVWPGYGKNRQSIGELWLGFLRFYVEKFDFARNVIAMKQVKTLSKFQKGWTHATMCIEDPFNLQHNLAAGISRNMFKYILGCFQNARLHFHTAHPHFRKNSGTDFLKQYFFNRNHLTENKNVPRDRLCHRCGRIGHTAANCAEKIVADRERRRLDSEKTYSSDNGDSDVNQNTKGKNSMDQVECYGCRKFGHRVANCPQKGKSPGKERHRNGNNRDRRDSDRVGNLHSRMVQTQHSPMGVQPASEMHPMENIDMVLPKTELITKFNPDSGRSRHSPKKDLRMKADDLQNINSLFSNVPQRKSTEDFKNVNSLFSSPSPRKSVDQREMAEGHIFSPKTTINELNLLQASVDGVSFLQTPPESPNEKPSILPAPGNSLRRKNSPLKPHRRLEKATSKSNNGEQDLPVFNNQSDFPSLGKSPNSKKSSWPTSAPPGFQLLSGEIKGNVTMLPNSPEFKLISQSVSINRMQSPDQQKQPLYHPFPNNKRGNDDAQMEQNKHGSGAMMNQVQTAQGFHFAQPGISRYMNNPNQRNINASPPTHHWPQPPAGSTGLSPADHSPSQSFQFANFVKDFENANSPPDGNKEFLSGSAPANGANMMKYDEEYPPTKSGATSPGKNGKKKPRKGKNRR